MSENPKKKLHFFNGGRGVNLSQFDEQSQTEGRIFQDHSQEDENEESMYAQSLSLPREIDANPSNDPPEEDSPNFQDESMDGFPSSNNYANQSTSFPWTYDPHSPSPYPSSSVDQQARPHSPSPVGNQSRAYSSSSVGHQSRAYSPSSVGYQLRPYSPPPASQHPGSYSPPNLGQSSSSSYCPTFNSLGMRNSFPTYPIQPMPIHPIAPRPTYIPTIYPGPSRFPDPTHQQGYLPHHHHSILSPLREMENGATGLSYPAEMHYGADMHDNRGGDESSSRKKKRQQKCSLCSNHGLQTDVKGHKWFCDYRNCNCHRCTITRGRQHHMKEQQKLTRHLQRLQ